MQTVRLGDLDVRFELAGSGPRLLFLNGSGATLESSAALIGAFRTRFEVLAHDQRGLGGTSSPPGPWTMADYAADALALLDHVGWATCRVVGVSFGGMVAQELAVTSPERVERLALLCTSAGGEGGSSYPLHELAELPAAERAATGLRILDARFTPEWLAEHPADRTLVELRAAGAAAPRTPAQLAGERGQLEARRHHDVWERLPKITCPTLVAAGRHDGIAPPANAHAIASRIPGAEVREYEGGHLFFAQDRSALPEVLRFLSR